MSIYTVTFLITMFVILITAVDVKNKPSYFQGQSIWNLYCMYSHFYCFFVQIYRKKDKRCRAGAYMAASDCEDYWVLCVAEYWNCGCKCIWQYEEEKAYGRDIGSTFCFWNYRRFLRVGILYRRWKSVLQREAVLYLYCSVFIVWVLLLYMYYKGK